MLMAFQTIQTAIETWGLWGAALESLPRHYHTFPSFSACDLLALCLSSFRSRFHRELLYPFGLKEKLLGLQDELSILVLYLFHHYKG